MNKKSKKVIVAMSGGVDSSVAAVLLKRAGFNIVGVFMKFWADAKDKGGNKCCSSDAENRARKTAKLLKIPFYVFNLEKEFKKRIVDSFLQEYKKGFTPNPCVICNKEIKFGLLLEKALKMGADYVATGHYARLRREFPISNFQFPIKSKIPIFKLLKGKDKNKDQSYFLWQLNQKQLKRVLFPIGGFTKSEVRKMARKFKLPAQKAPESMEVCFIKDTINDFLKRYLKEKPGKIVDKKGNIIGRHKGLWFYTIGQRKGLRLSGGPYFVLGKDIKRNVLLITKNEKDLDKKEVLVKNINWISGKEPTLPLKIKAKIRYHHTSALSRLSKLKTKNYKLIFNRPQRAITPGQSAVFYQGEELLGGGVIS